MAAFLNFRIFAKNEKKNLFASISLTVRDRAISSNFIPTGYLINALLAIFKKKFPLPKNGGHFEFTNFCQKNGKTQICFYLLNCAR